MPRLIDANEAIKIIRERTTGSGDNFDKIMTHLCRILEAAPTVEAVEVVHGRWIVEHEESVRCSECCFNRAYVKIPMDYCPNCGAKMDGDGNG